MDPSTGYHDPPFVAEFYDYVPPYRDRQDVAFFVEMASHAKGPVLEIGCGTGRVLIPTARAGVEIVGLDNSQSMLTVCREKLAREPEEAQSRVELVEADMRAFDLKKQFALVTIPFRPFQHLIRVEDQLSCLASIHRHLRKEGKVVLDMFNPSLPYLAGKQDPVDLLGEEPAFAMPDGRKVARTIRVVSRDWFNQVQEIEFIYSVTHPDGHEEQFVQRAPMRYVFRFEAEHLLARCGFEVEQLYADYDKTPYGSKYPGELIFVARKRA